MRRTLIAGAAAVLAAVTVPAPARARTTADEPAEQASCTEPDPARRYGPEALTYGLELDLSGCNWWKGGPIEMSASISRSVGADEAISDVAAYCGAPARPRHRAGQTEADPRHERAAPAVCSVDVEMEHPRFEIAVYRGEITYPWRDGERTVDFAALCTATPLARRCVNLP